MTNSADISPDWRERVLKKFFPNLIEGKNFTFTSPIDYNYNCLSWALRITHWPLERGRGSKWLWPHIPDDTAEGWANVLAAHGFMPAENLDFEAGVEKVAILQDENGDLHATRQENGKWKSKLGVRGPDIDHDDLECLESGYGKVVLILQRKLPNAEAAF